jgi:hypothetical protein
MSRIKLFVVGGLVLSSLAQGGCSGCNEEYYCDETGCFWCDSYGCRPVDPPEVAECSHGDWECPADRPFCTADGYCVATCSTDDECPTGLRCVEGFCLLPDAVTPPPLHPGYCGGTDVCVTGEYCAPSNCCLPTGGADCCADIDCADGLICDTEAHTCVTPPADAGTDDGTTDGGTDGPPPPPPQCRSNAECPAHYLCIDAVCMLPCETSAECGLGCECVGGFCTSPAA